MADGPGLHIHWVYTDNYDYNTIGYLSLGSARHSICQMGWFHRHGSLLPGRSDISHGFPHRRNRRTTVPIAKLPSSWNLLHSLRTRSLDHGHLRAVRGQSLPAAFLALSRLSIYRLSFLFALRFHHDNSLYPDFDERAARRIGRLGVKRSKAIRCFASTLFATRTKKRSALS